MNENSSAQSQKQNWIAPRKLLVPPEFSSPYSIDDLKQACSDNDCSQLHELLERDEAAAEFFNSVLRLSPYLCDILINHPIFAEAMLRDGPDAAFGELVERTELMGRQRWDDARIMRELRQAKKGAALMCGLCDMAGWWHASKTTKCITQFADASIRAALDQLLLNANKRGDFILKDVTEPQKSAGVFALAMGKHGAHELNYSSDIDLIMFFHERAEPMVAKTDPGTFFLRFAKSFVKLLQERTVDGYVFRVDLRLRPDPSSTPPILPLEAGLIYYESQGQNWERAAMIKARAVAGDMEAAEEFLQAIAPFIWRKNLDFAAINDVHSIKRQIHAHKGHAKIAAHGHNVKLGRGGIREIEFFVQTQQLIAGGRIPELRLKTTIGALNALCEHGWIEEDARDELTQCYWYLRDVEHRLQMVRDEQTHTLPDDDLEFSRIAAMLGYESSDAFSSELKDRLATVERHYASLFEAEPQLSSQAGNLIFTGDEDDPYTLATLSNMGFSRPDSVVRTVRAWHFGRYPALQTTRAKELLTELAPALLEKLANSGRADDALNGFDKFLSGLPAGIQLFSLVKSNPQLLELLVTILGSAPRLAQIITRNPGVFDGLIDPAFSSGIPDRTHLGERLEQFLSAAPDYETLLDRARKFAAEQKFLIGVRLITGAIDASQAGVAFSDLAQVMIENMQARVLEEFSCTHGNLSGGQMGVLGMGRLGSYELTAGSDLDLIFLYSHGEATALSDGQKPLPASLYFSRLTQRLIAAMSAPTAQGVIYELDFRLRPSGNAGPLATQLDGFVKYQSGEAWVWERQALTRSRMVSGEDEFKNQVGDAITKLLSRKNDVAELRREIADMRKRILAEKGSQNPWNCKNVDGGLIDIEFIVQFLVLASHGRPEDIAQTIPKTMMGLKSDLIGDDQRDKLIEAYGLYTTVIQVLRTCLDTEFDAHSADEGIKRILCSCTDLPDISLIETDLREYQSTVRGIFKDLMDG